MHTDTAGDLDPVALTSRITAALRAAESARPDALFDDPFAATLAGEAATAMLHRIDAGDAIAVRTRFDDDGLRAAVRAGVRQVVLVAAGMDTRAWRLELPGDPVVFELDRPAVLALKDDLLTGRAPAARRVPVPTDLAGRWDSDLLGAGFDPARPACWIVEGLLQYLPADAVGRLLDTVTGLSAPGAHLLVDVVGAALLRSARTGAVLETMSASGSPWVFGTDEPGELLRTRGWAPDVHTMADVAARLGRAGSARDLGGDAGGEHGYLLEAVRPERQMS